MQLSTTLSGAGSTAPAASSFGGGMNIAAMGATALSGLFSAFAMRQAAKAQNERLEFAQWMNDFNAQRADRASYQAMRAGREQRARSRLQYAQQRSRQRVAMAANGVALDEGSAVEMQATLDFFDNADAQTIELNALQQAWGYRDAALEQRMQSAGYEAKKVSPTVAQNSTLLTTASQLAQQWYRLEEGR